MVDVAQNLSRLKLQFPNILLSFPFLAHHQEIASATRQAQIRYKPAVTPLFSIASLLYSKAGDSNTPDYHVADIFATDPILTLSIADF